jgi:glycerol-3-phosphate acyltransferase PlsY
MNNILLFVAAYLLGSIPTAVWVGKHFYNIDVRDHGSGNAGATNVFRVLGKKAGIPVLLIDVIKGFLAVSLARFSQFHFGTTQFINLQLVLGVSSLIGHIFPVFASFKGGKGIATLLGIIIAVYPYAAFISILVFLVVFLISGFVSLGSMTAAVAFPIIVIYILKISTPSLVIFSILIAIMVLLTHKKNIGRLLRNEEPKTRLINKKK